MCGNEPAVFETGNEEGEGVGVVGLEVGVVDEGGVGGEEGGKATRGVDEGGEVGWG